MAALFDPAPLEQTLIQLRECFVYKVATTHSSRGFCAGDWGLDKPLATCTCIVKSRGEEAAVQLFDNKTKGQNKRKMLAQSVIVLNPDPTSDKSRIEWFCENVTDSSRYFVLKVQNPKDPKKIASLGIGFRQKESAYGFTAALQDHAKYVRRVRASKLADKNTALQNSEPAKDMTLKSMIKINVKLAKRKKKKKKKGKETRKTVDVGVLSGGMAAMSVTRTSSSGGGSSGNSGNNGVGVADEGEFNDDDFGDFS